MKEWNGETWHCALSLDWNWREERVTQGAVSSVLCRPKLAANLSWPKLLKALTLSLQISVLMTENDIVCSSQREPGAMLQALRDKQMLLPEEGLDCLLLQRAWGRSNHWKHARGEPKQEKVTLPEVLFTGVCALTIFSCARLTVPWLLDVEIPANRSEESHDSLLLVLYSMILNWSW